MPATINVLRALAETINGNTAQAQSTAGGSSGQAQATAQTIFADFNSFQTMATSQVGSGASASTIAQVGSAVSLPNINPGQSFSVASVLDADPLALGSMGAAYGGTGQSLTYQETADFIFNANGGNFLIDLLGNSSLGNGFDMAEFQIHLNGGLFYDRLFHDLASAQSFFSSDLIYLSLIAGLNNVQLSFNETMSSSGQGFSFDYAAAETPLPAALPLFASGLGALGLLGWRRKKKNAASIAA